mgnify:CR=1 FL=1
MGTWGEAIESVIQRALVLLADVDDPDSRELESALFVKCLHATSQEWHGRFGGAPAELDAFSAPIGMYVFSLQDRRYTCAEFIPPAGNQSAGDEPRRRLRTIIAGLARQLSSVNVDLTDQPTSRELESMLFDHLLESHRPDGDPDERPQTSALDWVATDRSRPLEARVAAIRNWQSRLQEHYRERYDHRLFERPWYAFPFVDVAMPDAEHVVLLLASPLDPQFVDEKVEERWQAPELTLAVFRAHGPAVGASLGEAEALLKQGFARSLFINVLNQNSQSLADSSQERAAILRHWVTVASAGLPTLLGPQLAKAPFDAAPFCEAIARKVLCAQIDGVHESEVFPFDRAFIFREGGAETKLSNEPMAVRVLEASVLSNAPADRGRFLTSRERRIRGTEEFECDLSQKRIEAENCFDFYIHPGNETTLLLSRKARLDQSRREAALQRQWMSRNPQQADHSGYRIAVPDLDDIEQRELDAAVYNLLGRLTEANCEDRQVFHPNDRDGGAGGWTVRAFKDDFERLRLKVTEKADTDGLTFITDHGLQLSADTPTLSAVQRAYFAYLDDRFREQDERFLRDRARQDNMQPDQVDALLSRDRELRLLREQEVGEEGDEEVASSRLSKVVYVSFSWELHDQNTRLWLERSRAARRAGSSDDAQEAKALLGEEYTFTLVLVADKDPEKSRARLQSERDDLKLFFQLLMGRLWSDRLSEFNYLDKRSRSIGLSLQQFMHQVKGKLDKSEDRREIDDLLKNLKKLISSERAPVEWLPMGNAAVLLGRLLGDGLQDGKKRRDGEDRDSGDKRKTEAAARLQSLCRRLVTHAGGRTDIAIKVSDSRLAPVSVLWSEAVIRDAFLVAVKNAVEAASETPPGAPAFVSLQLQTIQRTDEASRREWFVDVVIENSGGPISKQRLAALNSPDPMAVRPGAKTGSTGIGIFLSRYQLREVVGFGADLLIANVESSVVQCRLRLPGRRAADSGEAQASDRLTVEADQEYLLYVEDTPDVFEAALPVLTELAHSLQIGFEHCRGAWRAAQLIKKRLPRVLLSDLHIQRSESPEEQALERYGIEFLLLFMKTAEARGFLPPVWLFTGEDPASVKRQFAQRFAESSWVWLNVEGASEADLAGQGAVCVMPQKRPQDVDLAWLTALLRATNPAPDLEFAAEATAEPTTPHVGQPRWLQVGFDELIPLALRGDIDPLTVAAVTETARTRGDLADILCRWFQLPGVPDPDPTFPGEIALHPVTDSVVHHHVVLFIATSARLWSTLTPPLVYWALGRNIVLCRQPPKLEDLARRWSSFPREENGPLSRLRHDLKAGWSRADLRALLARALQALNTAETLLLLPQDEVALLEASLRQGGADARVRIINRLGRAEETARQHELVLNSLHRVRELIGQARGKPSYGLEAHARHDRLARTLEHFIGGER